MSVAFYAAKGKPPFENMRSDDPRLVGSVVSQDIIPARKSLERAHRRVVVTASKDTKNG